MIPANANPKLQDAKWLQKRYVAERASVAAMATEAGCDVSQVHRALRRNNIPPRGRADGVDVRHLSKTEITKAYRAVRFEATEASGPLGNRMAASRFLGVTEHKLRDAEYRLGLSSHPLAAAAKKAYEDGMTIPAVANLLSISSRQAMRILTASGVRKRPRGRPVKK